MYERLQSLIQIFLDFLCRHQHLLTLLLLVACLSSLAFVWYEFSLIEVWRHDALYYIDSYRPRLLSEGRWLNYLLFNQLRQVNPQLSAVLHIVSLCTFIFFAAYAVSRNRTHAAFLALLAAAAVPVYVQLLWPVTTLPAFLFVGFTVLLYRYLPPFLFFASSGLILFGSMSYLYFLLPLLYMPRLVGISLRNGRALVSFFIRILIPWVLGYVAGLLFALTFIWFESSEVGMSIAQWRRPNPAVDIYSLVRNIAVSADYLRSHVLVYLDYAGFLLTGFIFMYAFWVYRNRTISHLLVPVLVLLSLYASIVPLSVTLSFRSSLNTWAGLVFLFLVVPGIRRVELPVCLIAIFLLILANSWSIREDLNWYRQSTKYYLDQLNTSLPKSSDQYEGVILLSERSDFEKVEQQINSSLDISHGGAIKTVSTPARWSAIASQAGFRKFYLCDQPIQQELCEIARSAPVNPDRQGSSLYTLSEQSGWLVVRLANGLPSRTTHAPDRAHEARYVDRGTAI